MGGRQMGIEAPICISADPDRIVIAAPKGNGCDTRRQLARSRRYAMLDSKTFQGAMRTGPMSIERKPR
jgi:hypothetical protein